MPTVVIAAGGTAGHVVPALAVAAELRASGARVVFIGTRERAEAELVPAAGYQLEHVSAAGLDRRNPLRAAGTLVRAAGAVVSAWRLLGRMRPDAVLGGGGYLAGVVGLAAALRGIPLVLTESDSRLGLSNRLLARFARRVCLAFPITRREGDRYLVTGRPVPAAVLEASRESAREQLGVENGGACLLVFGGSLGARSINLRAVEAFARPAAEGEITVLHVSGRRDHDEVARMLAAAGSPAGYKLFDYLDSLAAPLAACDLVLARAGGSVLEIAAAGRPALLVPYPHAAAGHQDENARWMTDAGAAISIADQELDAERLQDAVAELLRDRERLQAMSDASRRLARPDAAARIADEVLAAAATPAPSGDRAVARERPWAARRLHFVGIGGAGMSGLALVARSLGAEVSGCDRAQTPYTEMLRLAGIDAVIGHSPEHVEAGMDVVVSTAVPSDAPELAAAARLGLRVIARGSLLADVASLRNLVAVAGTHGKTTTAAMAAHVLRECGLDPGYVVGAELRTRDGRPLPNAALGGGQWLVAEGDESDRSFLELRPQIAVVTNVELDHHSTYGSLAELEQAFAQFLRRLPAGGGAVLWQRSGLRALVPAGVRLLTFDVEHDADLVARDVRADGMVTRFQLVHESRPQHEVVLAAPGRHNVLNALAALAAVELIGGEAAGCEPARAARALASFEPAGRRFEPRGEARSVRVVDDYAHHPTEVAAAIEAARALEPRRLVAVFQPHLYSRTLHLHRELGRALAAADVAVVLDVYAARERPEGDLEGVTGKLVADACADAARGRQVWWLPTLEEAEAALARNVDAGDLVLTLGAGDVDTLGPRLLARLANGVRGDGS